MDSFQLNRPNRIESRAWNAASTLDVLYIALEEDLYAFIDCARELASPAPTARRFGIARMTFDLTDITQCLLVDQARLADSP